jgi:hypothetical protein
MGQEDSVRDYAIELEIYEGNGGQLRPDGTSPDFAKDAICAWMYGRFQKGQKFRYPEDLGELCPWLVDCLTGVIRALSGPHGIGNRHQGHTNRLAAVTRTRTTA